MYVPSMSGWNMRRHSAVFVLRRGISAPRAACGSGLARGSSSLSLSSGLTLGVLASAAPMTSSSISYRGPVVPRLVAGLRGKNLPESSSSELGLRIRVSAAPMASSPAVPRLLAGVCCRNIPASPSSDVRRRILSSTLLIASPRPPCRGLVFPRSLSASGPRSWVGDALLSDCLGEYSGNSQGFARYSWS